MAMATKFFAVLLFALIAISMLQTMVKNVCAFVCVVFQLAFTLYLSFFKYYDFLKQWFVLIFPGWGIIRVSFGQGEFAYSLLMC